MCFMIIIHSFFIFQGILTCTPNAKNHRDLDITLTYDFKGRSYTAKGSQFFRLR